MRILVVSDSHGRWGALHNVIAAHPEAETVIHLGDGFEDLERLRSKFPGLAMFGVTGNCDFSASANARASALLTIGGKKIFCTHGHIYRVKSGLSLLEQAARSHGADFCLFGHTHIPFNECHGGMYIMNPGSVGHPRDGCPTCGIIDITESGIRTAISDCDI